MSLIIVTGSNLSNPIENLNNASSKLQESFQLISKSRIYISDPIEYLEQPLFYNQALEFALPKFSCPDGLQITKRIEDEMGRIKKIDKGPRLIDIDIIFWGTQRYKDQNLEIPHPAWSQRSFVVLPIKELKAYQLLKNNFIFPVDFDNIATPLED